MNSLIHPALAQVMQAERVVRAVGAQRERRPRRIRSRRSLRRPVPSFGTGR